MAEYCIVSVAGLHADRTAPLLSCPLPASATPLQLKQQHCTTQPSTAVTAYRLLFTRHLSLSPTSVALITQLSTMTALSILIPAGYGLVLLEVLALGAHCVSEGFAGYFIRKRVFSKAFFSTHFPELKPPPEDGYPDLGQGRYSDKLSQRDWEDLANAQRAHYNYVEQLGTQVTALVSSQWQTLHSHPHNRSAPLTASCCCVVWCAVHRWSHLPASGRAAGCWSVGWSHSVRLGLSQPGLAWSLPRRDHSGHIHGRTAGGGRVECLDDRRRAARDAEYSHVIHQVLRPEQPGRRLGSAERK